MGPAREFEKLDALVQVSLVRLLVLLNVREDAILLGTLLGRLAVEEAVSIRRSSLSTYIASIRARSRSYSV
jgi:hypothetical protein